MLVLGSRRLLALAGLLVLLAFAQTARAQGTQVKPYFMVIVDNSGSMRISTGAGNNSCGMPQVRINDAKCVLNRVVNSTGDAVFGLERYATNCSGTCTATCCGATCPDGCGCACTYLNCSGCADSGAGCPATGSTAAQGQILVPILEDNQANIVEWVDFTCGTCGVTAGANPELTQVTWTPIAGSLRGARRYYQGGDPTFPTSPISGDVFSGCRPYSVILLTDGEETCASDAQTLAATTELRATVFGGNTYDIRTYVIGFGIAAGDANIEAIANAGGTDAPGAYRGFYATDETTLSLAFSQIIASSVLIEICDNLDNDCDTLVDEGFTKYCNIPGGVLTTTLCADPGDPCNGVDDNCFNGVADEMRNACGGCGPLPAEICNGIDDNCNGLIDEGCTCTPTPEICNNFDDDCDGMVDGFTRSCGTSATPPCRLGAQLCTAGLWGACAGAIDPTTEICNGVDDDCDGRVDGIVRSCGLSNVGTCRYGTQTCTAGAWGACSGSQDPTPEVCNRLDDDCNGLIDDATTDSGAGCTTGAGCPGVVQCIAGTLSCAGSSTPTPETCNGLDDNCNGLVDEGDPDSGGSCWTDQGDCMPGTEHCCTPALVGSDVDCTAAAVGSLYCRDEVGPFAEVCDGRDNDCNGTIDDGIATGGPCGTDEGECVAGVLACVSGTDSCVGQVLPTTERCDCLDNDCDAMTDEDDPPGSLCPSGSQCIGCMCASPCVGEFCPGTLTCVGGYCVTDRCAGVVCTPSTWRCNPSTGLCEDPCLGVPCPSPLVCVGGRCLVNDCYSVPCPAGQICVSATCVADPCVGVSCPAGEYCRNGTCAASSCPEPCASGQSCIDGICQVNRCLGVNCPTNQYCDPATGTCRGSTSCAGGCGAGRFCNFSTGTCQDNPCDLGWYTCPLGSTCRIGSDWTARCVGPTIFPPHRVYPSGGGGCRCGIAPGAGSTAGAPGLPILAGLGLVVLGSLRRRRRRA